jgi:hypothetical protein
MTHENNAAKPMTRQFQMPFTHPRLAHISDGSTDQISAFLTARRPHSKNAVTISRNCYIAFSSRNINPGVAGRKTAPNISFQGTIFSADYVCTTRNSSRTAGF